MCRTSCMVARQCGHAGAVGWFRSDGKNSSIGNADNLAISTRSTGGKLVYSKMRGDLTFRFALADFLLRQQIKVPCNGQVRAAGCRISCGLGIRKACGGVRPIAGGSLQGGRHFRVPGG